MIFKHKLQQLIPNVAAISKTYPELSKLLSEIISVISGMSRDVYDDIQSVNNTEYTSTTLPSASDAVLGKTAIVTSGSHVFYKLCVISGSAYVWKNIKISIVGEYFLSDGSDDYTKFDTSGHQSMAGNSRPWRDELGELLGKKRLGTRITEDLAEGAVLFADNCQIADDYVITNVQLNHDKDLSAPLHPHLHWFQASANVPNWMIQYRWQKSCGVKVTSWTSAKYTSHACAYSSGTIHQITGFGEIAVPVGTDLSDIVQFRILRDTDNDSTLFTGADPLSGNASALMFDIHFQTNSLGSTEEYEK
jgi:hypothetical protein